MNFSDWTQVVTSIVAVVIATGSFWWSIKIQHDANQPYVVATLEPVRIHGYNFVYLIVKNYGRTGAIIRNLKASKPLVVQKGSPWTNNPFETINGNLLAPAQSIKSGLTVNEAAAQMKIDVSEFDYSFEWAAVGSARWKTSIFHLDLSAALNDHVLYAKPTPTSKRVEMEINKLSQIVAEVGRESTLNRL